MYIGISFQFTLNLGQYNAKFAKYKGFTVYYSRWYNTMTHCDCARREALVFSTVPYGNNIALLSIEIRY